MTRQLTYLEQDHWQLWLDKRDKESADFLIQQYIPLVQYHVKRISVGLPKNLRLDDLFSHGLLGLYDALEKFDHKRDLKFDTYASFRIRGAIIDGLRKDDWMPRSIREKSKKIEHTIEKLEQRYMRHVTPEEVAEVLELPTEDITGTITEGLFANLLSLEDDGANESGDQLSYAIEDKRAEQPDESMVVQEKYKQLAEHIATLNEKEQLVVSLFYFEELTLTEIGQILGLSTSRISQIHSKALFKLRHVLTKSSM